MSKSKSPKNSKLPDEVLDNKLGTIRFSCALDGQDEFTCNLKLDGRRVEVLLYTDEKFSLRPAIRRIKEIVESFSKIQCKIENYIKANIFPNYNQNWRPNSRPFSLEQLLRKLKLRSITVHPTPNATFWFDAADVFQHHGLQIFMGPRFVFTEHDFPG